MTDPDKRIDFAEFVLRAALLVLAAPAVVWLIHLAALGVLTLVAAIVAPAVEIPAPACPATAAPTSEGRGA